MSGKLLEVSHQCSRQGDERNDEEAPLDHVTQRKNEDNASSIASLEQGGYLGGLLVGDIKGLSDPVEDGLVVVEVRDGEGRRLG